MPEHIENGVLQAAAMPLFGEEEAVELGLIDQIGGLSDALACLHEMIGEKKTGPQH